MKLVKKTQKIGTYQVHEELVAATRAATSWDQDRNKLQGLSDSRSILFRYNPSSPASVIPKLNRETRELYNMFLPLVEYVQSLVGHSYCSKAFLTNLPAGGKIGEHIDPGWLFTLQRRYHWVLQTNDDCSLSVDHIDYHFERSEIWEIDNKRLHSAANGGVTERLHFIFDLFMIDEAIGETPRPFDEDSFDARLFNSVLKKNKRSGSRPK